MIDKRKDCQMRHENGNCTVAGGFCTAVNDPVCEALHNAFDCGYRSSIRVHQETVTNRNGLKAVEIDQVKPLTLDELRKMDGEPVWVCFIDGVVMRDDGWFIFALLNESQAILEGKHPVYKNLEVYGKTWLAYRQKQEV